MAFTLSCGVVSDNDSILIPFTDNFSAQETMFGEDGKEKNEEEGEEQKKN